ncbi:MAG: hypothetical protein DI533_16985 [Cereibacter sphaeroides]|uniref:Uncharacterized protein n=1 Tax=Cereibacter sphaeroides TaxID=1063 RepID=A0A2W5TZ95_CERSP|nr:MAG: hypothetical protein DI533_16985 [Cereibacter sphaeroides]
MGMEFEVCHRTVAEFLAARFLARAVTGTEANHAFPLRRAIALITGADGRAPSELRGSTPGSRPIFTSGETRTGQFVS